MTQLVSEDSLGYDIHSLPLMTFIIAIKATSHDDSPQTLATMATTQACMAAHEFEVVLS